MEDREDSKIEVQRKIQIIKNDNLELGQTLLIVYRSDGYFEKNARYTKVDKESAEKAQSVAPSNFNVLHQCVKCNSNPTLTKCVTDEKTQGSYTGYCKNCLFKIEFYDWVSS
jgi:hypothetical protein